MYNNDNKVDIYITMMFWVEVTTGRYAGIFPVDKYDNIYTMM